MALSSCKSEIIRHRPLKQLVQQLQHPYQCIFQKQKQVLLDIDQIKRNLKQSWRGNKIYSSGGDNGNREFGKLTILKNKMLNSWEIQRMGLSQRSYSTPKESKGYKFTATSKEFAIKDEKALHSKPFQKYLEEIQERYQNSLFRADSSRYGNNETINKMSASSMKFGKSSNYFGCTSKDNSFKTLKSFKSEIGFKSHH